MIEKSKTGYGAYVPDLPGCIAAGESETEVKQLIAEAIEVHLKGLIEDGEPVPMPSSESFTVDVHAAY
ncbi:MAG: type II toxin-antitoxin system HicB family antitoxin [Deinococcota bacterium]